MSDREGQARPLKPGLDSLTGAILGAHEFARDTGGELFLLPGSGLRDQPYIGRSFLTADVANLAHKLWRDWAITWNGYRALHPDAGPAVAYTPSDTLIRNAVRHLEALGAEHGRRVTAELWAVQRGGGIVIDLGDVSGDVISVTAGGWKVTGHRDTFRRMRTNFVDISMAYRRTFVATGLSLPYGLAADALERVIEIPMSPIADSERVNEDDMRAELDEARPSLLGALLDHVAKVLEVLPGFTVDGGGLGLRPRRLTVLHRYQSAVSGELEQLVLQRKESVALEAVALLLQTFSEYGLPRFCLPGSCPLVPFLVVTVGQRVTTEAACHCGD